MKTIITLAIVILCVTSVFAQPDSLWSRAYGGAGEDSLWSMVATLDGGYMLAGMTTTHQNNVDPWLVKVNDQGGMEWSQNCGDSTRDEFHDVIERAEGGFALTGLVYGRQRPIPTCSVLFLTVNENGMPQNRTALGGGGGNYDVGNSILQRADGGFAIGGVDFPGGDTLDDFSLWTTDRFGSITGRCNYGVITQTESARNMIRSADGNYILTGGQIIYDENNTATGFMMLVKANDDLHQEWLYTFPTANEVGWANSVAELPDGGYILCGTVGYTDPDWGVLGWNCRVRRTDQYGIRVWQRDYDFGRDEWGMSVINVEGGLVIVGIAGENAEGMTLVNTDCFLLRINENGDSLWSQQYGGRDDDCGMKVLQAPDGGYFIGGTTSSIGNGAHDFWLLKTSPDPLSAPSSGRSYQPSFLTLAPLYPNPLNGAGTIRFELPIPSAATLGLYAADGRLVRILQQESLTRGEHIVQWNAAGVASGNYFVRLKTPAGEMARAVTVLK